MIRFMPIALIPVLISPAVHSQVQNLPSPFTSLSTGAPVIDSVQNNRAHKGSKVTIRGRNFHMLGINTPFQRREVIVKFGASIDYAATTAAWQFVSPTEIWAWVPPEAQDVPITILERRTTLFFPVPHFVQMTESPYPFECLGPFPVRFSSGGPGTITEIRINGIPQPQLVPLSNNGVRSPPVNLSRITPGYRIEYRRGTAPMQVLRDANGLPLDFNPYNPLPGFTVSVVLP